METGKQRKIGLREDNLGTTLVEMLACFALVGILMAAAAGLISVTMETYYSVRQTEYGTQTLARMLDRIKEVLGTVDSREEIRFGEEGSDIRFVDQKGREVTIQKDTEGYLEILYRDRTTLETNLWKLDPKAYMGSNIQTIRFFRPCEEDPGEYEDNVVGVDIVVQNKVYGVSRGTGYVEYLKLR